MTTFKMTTVFEITEQPPVTIQSEIASDGITNDVNETIHSVLKGHIALLQNELENVEISMGRKRA